MKCYFCNDTKIEPDTTRIPCPVCAPRAHSEYLAAHGGGLASALRDGRRDAYGDVMPIMFQTRGEVSAFIREEINKRYTSQVAFSLETGISETRISKVCCGLASVSLMVTVLNKLGYDITQKIMFKVSPKV